MSSMLACRHGAAIRDRAVTHTHTHTSHLHTPLTLWKPRLIASTHRGRPFHTPIPSSSPGSVSTLHILLVMVYGSKSADSGVRNGHCAPFVLRPLLVDGFKTPLQTSQSMHCVLVVKKTFVGWTLFSAISLL